MSTRRNFWPHLGAILTGVAAVIYAMSHLAQAVGGDTQTKEGTVPTPQEQVGNLPNPDDRLKDNENTATQVRTARIAAQAAKDNAGRLHKLGLAQKVNLSTPETWLLAEATYDDASREMTRHRFEAALRGFRRAAEHYEKAIRLSTTN